MFWAPLVDKRKQNTLGVAMSATAVGADPWDMDATKHLHTAELSEQFTHST